MGKTSKNYGWSFAGILAGVSTF